MTANNVLTMMMKNAGNFLPSRWLFYPFVHAAIAPASTVAELGGIHPTHHAMHQSMKKNFLLTIFLAGAFAVISWAEPKAQSASPAAALTPTLQESATLADACRMTLLMNEGKWDDVEKALGTKEGMVALLRHHASLKDWPGIGAYRGSRVDEQSPWRITHRFGFSPRTNPHEIWISYTMTESGPTKPKLMVLGW